MPAAIKAALTAPKTLAGISNRLSSGSTARGTIACAFHFRIAPITHPLTSCAYHTALKGGKSLHLCFMGTRAARRGEKDFQIREKSLFYARSRGGTPQWLLILPDLSSCVAGGANVTVTPDTGASTAAPKAGL